MHLPALPISSALPYHRQAAVSLSGMLSSFSSSPPIHKSLSEKLSWHGKFPVKIQVWHPRCLPANAKEPEQRPCCRSWLRQGGLAATSFPDTAIPLGCKADVNSPSAARWCKGKSLHGKVPAELTSRLFPAPKSQCSCTLLISVCHN